MEAALCKVPQLSDMQNLTYSLHKTLPISFHGGLTMVVAGQNFEEVYPPQGEHGSGDSESIKETGIPDRNIYYQQIPPSLEFESGLQHSRN